jgi:hypothetical protein
MAMENPPTGLLRKVLIVAVLVEVASGVALVVLPGTASWLVFGAASDGAGRAMARLAGVALVALAVACWPTEGARWPQRGLLAYNVFAAILLLSIGGAGQTVGWFLWPAGIGHAVLAVLLAVLMFWRTVSGR